MGIIERSLVVEGKKSQRVTAFFDSGSSFSIVSNKIVSKLQPLKVVNASVEVELGDGSKLRLGKRVLLNVRMNKRDFPFYFHTGDIPDDLLIGVDFLQKFGHTLEFKKDKIITKPLHLRNRRGKYVL